VRQRSGPLLIYGGSFDPPHVAHATLPPIVADRLECDRILYVPAAMSPHKTDDPPANPHHRLAMLAMALADVPNADISTVEITRDGPSYTIDTLRHLQSTYDPGTVFYLLIGTDQALKFPSWRESASILEIATPAVMLRPPLDTSTFHQRLCDVYGDEDAALWMSWTVRVPLLDVSSSDIRKVLRRGGDLNGIIDPAVLDYICRENLYGVASMTGG